MESGSRPDIVTMNKVVDFTMNKEMPDTVVEVVYDPERHRNIKPGGLVGTKDGQLGYLVSALPPAGLSDFDLLAEMSDASVKEMIKEQPELSASAKHLFYMQLRQARQRNSAAAAAAAMEQAAAAAAMEQAAEAAAAAAMEAAAAAAAAMEQDDAAAVAAMEDAQLVLEHK